MTATPLRIAVTGSTGFIGREVVRQLEAAGHGVVPLRRTPDAAGTWKRLCAEIDGLIHLAAPATDVTDERADAALENTRLVFAALPDRPLRLVYASSLAVFRPPRATERLTEASAVYGAEPSPAEDCYTRMKGSQERMVRELCDARPCTLTIVRPSNVWDETHWFQPCVGPKVGPFWFVVAPSRPLRLVHVVNCARAFVAALDLSDGRVRTVNVDDEAGTSAWGFATRTIGWREHGYLPVPIAGGVFEGAAALASCAMRMLAPGRRLPGLLFEERRAARLGAFRVDSTLARTTFGWLPDLLFYRRAEAGS